MEAGTGLGPVLTGPQIGTGPADRAISEKLSSLSLSFVLYERAEQILSRYGRERPRARAPLVKHPGQDLDELAPFSLHFSSLL